MTRSMISPDTIWLKKTELTESGLFLILKVRSNIREITIEDERDGNHIEYEYDEVETKYQVPITLTSVADVKDFILAKTTDIVLQGTREKAWKEINDTPIEELRKTVSVTALKLV